MEELTIKIPSWIKRDDAEIEFKNNLKAKAQLKMEYFRSKMLPFEKKYKCNFKDLNLRIHQETKEDFEKWDDYIEWEAIFKAFSEWKARLEELKN